jgi:hypothetical protein
MDPAIPVKLTVTVPGEDLPLLATISVKDAR